MVKNDLVRNLRGIFCILHLVTVLVGHYSKPAAVPFNFQFGNDVEEMWGGLGDVLIAGKLYHITYEPLYLKIVLLLDAPSVLLMSPFIGSIYSIGVTAYSWSFVLAAIFLAFTSIQWFLIGHVISRILTKRFQNA
jgi:hypothetical protein